MLAQQSEQPAPPPELHPPQTPQATPQSTPQPSPQINQPNTRRSFELSTRSLFRNPNNDTKKKLITTVITLFADIVCPVVLYFVLKIWIAAVWALLAAAGPAFLSVIVKLAWKRQVDLIGVLVFFAFGISAVVAIVTHNTRILLMEKSVVTAILGAVFWLTLIPFPIPELGRKKKKAQHGVGADEIVPPKEQPVDEKNKMKPFLFYAFKQLIPLGKMDVRITGYDIERYEWFWASLPSFKKHVRVLTAVWGFGLLAEFGGRLAMVLSKLSTDDVVLYANIYFAVLIGILLIFSGLYGVRARKNLLVEINVWLTVRQQEILESGAVKVEIQPMPQVPPMMLEQPYAGAGPISTGEILVTQVAEKPIEGERAEENPTGEEKENKERGEEKLEEQPTATEGHLITIVEQEQQQTTNTTTTGEHQTTMGENQIEIGGNQIPTAAGENQIGIGAPIAFGDEMDNIDLALPITQ